MLFSCLHDQSAELLELLDVHNLLMSKVQLVNVQKQPEKNASIDEHVQQKTWQSAANGN